MATKAERHADKLAGLRALEQFITERNALRAVLVTLVEEYFGCPIEDIRPHEKTTWANRFTKSKAELDVVLAAISRPRGGG